MSSALCARRAHAASPSPGPTSAASNLVANQCNKCHCAQVCVIFAWGGTHNEILQKPGRPLRPALPLPSYLPTYLTYAKEITGSVKVGCYTN